MPLPIPRGGDNPEKESEFIGRCMDDDIMRKEYPDSKQRIAVCYSQWRRKK